MSLKSSKKVIIFAFLLVGVAVSGFAQAPKKKTPAKDSPAVTADDIRELREMLKAQQQQIDELRQQLAQRDEQARASQAAEQQAQAAAQKADAAQAAIATNADSLRTMQGEITAIKTNVGSVSSERQETDKRIAVVEGMLSRFRFSGDLRVRGESFFQSYDGCGAACADRNRARIRVRFGVDGKLNEDFVGGIAVASGAVVNGSAAFLEPVATNETLTSFYERKTFGIDRGYVTYTPHQAKWLSMTGGKWAYSWNRTALTWDVDLNPEGFNLKGNWDLHNEFVKNFNVQALALLYNEVSSGADSNAVGMSASAKFQLGRLITWTPTYNLLNWNGSDAIAQAASPVTLPNPNTTAVGTPTATPSMQPVRVINANAFTNSSVIVGTGANQRRAFLSDFMYSDFINDFTVLTPFKRYPARFFFDYEKNLRARAQSPTIGKQDQAYWAEFSLGQQKNRNDVLFGYSFADIDQDAVISQFNESDMRAPTNVKQHRVFANWLIFPNTTAAATLWRGHTKYTGLQNAARTPGVAPGQADPFLNRMQFDIIYKF